MGLFLSCCFSGNGTWVNFDDEDSECLQSPCCIGAILAHTSHCGRCAPCSPRGRGMALKAGPRENTWGAAGCKARAGRRKARRSVSQPSSELVEHTDLSSGYCGPGAATGLCLPWPSSPGLEEALWWAGGNQTLLCARHGAARVRLPL